MITRLDRFYAVMPDAGWVQRVVALGARLVQLRVKDAGGDTLRREVRSARDVCLRHGAQLIVNDHWQVAIEAGCDFVHLGQQDLDAADLTAIRRARLRLGISTHDHAELQRALQLAPDYIALGPVYPTLLKVMPWAPQGLARVTEWKDRIGGIPLVAIGGLTVPRLAGVFAAGADIAAVVTDIVRAGDPDARTREWLAATRGTPA